MATEEKTDKANFIGELRNLVELKKAGELGADEFKKAKSILLQDAVSGIESGQWDEAANATNRPIEKGKKYRKRSAADWVARMTKDLKGQENDAAEDDPRKNAHLALVNEFTLAWTPNNNSSDLVGDVAEGKFQAAFEKFWDPEGYLYYAGAQWGPVEGVYNIKSGQASKLWALHTNRGEYNFDFANAKIFSFDNILFMDFGFYPIQAKDGYAGKGSGPTFTLRNKLAYYFNEDGTKFTKMICYSETEQDCKDIRPFYEAIGLQEAIAKEGLKPDAKSPGKGISTYKGDTTATWAPPLGKW